MSATQLRLKKFAREYFEHNDLRRAARSAGSKAKEKNLYNVGYAMLHNPIVEAELERLGNLADEKSTQSVSETKAEVHSLIDEGIKLARSGTPLLTKQGALVEMPDGTVARRADIPSLLKAAELKGKTVAMFTDRQEIAGEMEGMSNQELESFFIGALISNPLLLKRICSEDIVIRGVHEFEREAAESRQGGSGDEAEEAEPVGSASEAGRLSPGRLH